MRRHSSPTVLIVTTLLLVALTPSAAAAGPARHDPPVPLCFVPKAAPQVEVTIHVPSRVADHLVRKTLSYHGPCAAYGESARRGNGTLTAYSQAERGVPTAIGLVFPSGTLDGLPFDPPTAEIGRAHV